MKLNHNNKDSNKQTNSSPMISSRKKNLFNTDKSDNGEGSSSISKKRRSRLATPQKRDLKNLQLPGNNADSGSTMNLEQPFVDQSGHKKSMNNRGLNIDTENLADNSDGSFNKGSEIKQLNDTPRFKKNL